MSRRGRTHVHNAAISDQNLPADAFALLCFVASHNANFKVHRTLIIKRFGWSKDRYYKAKNLLEDLGYAIAHPTSADGKFTGSKWTIDWEPLLEKPCPADKDTGADQPCPKKKDTALSLPAVSGEEGHLRRTDYKNNQSNSKATEYSSVAKLQNQKSQLNG